MALRRATRLLLLHCAVRPISQKCVSTAAPGQLTAAELCQPPHRRAHSRLASCHCSRGLASSSAEAGEESSSAERTLFETYALLEQSKLGLAEQLLLEGAQALEATPAVRSDDFTSAGVRSAVQ